MRYDFDQVIQRRNTGSSKWDNVRARVGNADALPMWVADTDFPCPRPVVDAVIARAKHPIYGYPYLEPGFYSSTGCGAGTAGRWTRSGWSLPPGWFRYSTP